MDNSVAIPLQTKSLEMFRAVGMIGRDDLAPSHLTLFATQSDRVLENIRELARQGEMTPERASDFQQLIVDCCAWVMSHPIIAGNKYLERFSQGVTFDQARHEIQQFSVFGLQFDVAQAQLVSNAPTEEAYRERLKVLLNEKGIPYKDGFDGELTGQWSPATIHFTWMQSTAEGLGLTFEEIGKSWIGHAGTNAFVDATFDYYANLDQNIALGASFAIENWAANSLWTPWIAGMKKLNETRDQPVDLGYLTYHEKQEEHHSQATLDELFENFQQPWFDSDKFLEGAESILTEGVQRYYDSQLENMPDKDDTWPSEACEPRSFDPAWLPRISTQWVTRLA